MAEDGKFRVLRLIATTGEGDEVYVLAGAVATNDGDKAKRKVAADTKTAGVHVAVPPSSWSPEFMELELEPRVKARAVGDDDLEGLPILGKKHQQKEDDGGEASPPDEGA